MAQKYGLTKWSLKAMLSKMKVKEAVVQLLEFRVIKTHSNKTPVLRCRLLLNDGCNTFSFVTVTPELNHRLLSNEFPNLSVITIGKYIRNTQMKNGIERKMLIIFEMKLQIPGYQIWRIIGTPTHAAVLESWKLTPWKNLLMVREERVDIEFNKPYYFMLRATIMQLENMESALYRVCPQAGCSSPVMELQPGTDSFRCDRCNKVYHSFKWRLKLLITIEDFDGCIRSVTVFQRATEFILGKRAAELAEIRLGDSDTYEEILNDSLFKSFFFRVRIKIENVYNLDKREIEHELRYSVSHVEHVDSAAFTARSPRFHPQNCKSK